VDLRYSDSDEEFRSELRSWLEQAVPAHGDPPPPDDWEARRAYDTGWQRKLYEAGYACINWPKEYGGRDASPTEQLVYYEEIGRAKAPYVGINFVGVMHGGPTLIAEGTPEQKARHVPRILRG
jgi:alkylation response protein AidB-like acyl-CoA dehydrogenase